MTFSRNIEVHLITLFQATSSDSGTNIGLIVGPLVAILLIGVVASVVAYVLLQRWVVARCKHIAPNDDYLSSSAKIRHLLRAIEDIDAVIHKTSM